jgi:4-amino-4-deoxy-L-arabinose transferase-like glycosyltransferase
MTLASRSAGGRMRHPVELGLLLLVLAHLVVGSIALDAIPRSFGDESWNAMPVVELVRSGQIRMTALPGRGGLDHAYVQPKLTATLLAAPLAALDEFSLTAFRLSAVWMGALTLVATYALALFQFDRRTALLTSILLSVHFWFLMTARTYRPEIFETGFLVLYAWLLLRTHASGSRHTAWAAGVAATAAAMSHQLAAIMLLPMTGLILVASGVPRRRLRALAHVAGAALVAALPYVVYVVLVSRQTDVSVWNQLTGEGQGMELTPSAVFAKELARWSNFFLFPLGVPTLLITLLATGVGLSRGSRNDRLQAGLVGLTVVVLALCVPLAYGRYAVLTAPFASILVARLVMSCLQDGGPPLWRLTRTVRRRRLLATGLAGLYLAPMIGAEVATIAAHRDASFGRMVERLRAQVGEAPVVAGPVAFWLAFTDRTYVVTNVAPFFGSPREDVPEQWRWLEDRMDHMRPHYVLETTTSLQSTEGLAPRPTQFRANALNQYLRRHGQVHTVIESRDFGPVRIWSLRGHSAARAGRAAPRVSPQ